MTDNNYPHFSTAGWLPNGMKVFFTVPIDNYDTAYDLALQFTNMLLSQGLRLTEPGLEAGEQSYSITHILRRTQPGKDGKPPTPIIDFYHDNLKWSDLKTWLNTPEQIADFEKWSGIALQTMQPFPGGRMERGANPITDTAYVVQLDPPRKIVWKLNPDYVEGSKTESKRLFERFDNALNSPSEASNPRATASSLVTTPETSENAPNAVSDDITLLYALAGKYFSSVNTQERAHTVKKMWTEGAFVGKSETECVELMRVRFQQHAEKRLR